MALISQIIGICPMGMADVPAEDSAKLDVARQAGEMMIQLIERNLRPSQLITRKGAGKRDRGSRGDRWQHQRRAAHAGVRARGGHRFHD